MVTAALIWLLLLNGTPLMHRISPAPRGESAVEAKVTIDRPVTDVFGFYRDFRNLPRFLGDVMNVESIDATTSRWTIEGPLGTRLNWTVKITDAREDESIRYETIASPPLRTYWEVRFVPGPGAGQTEVRETMKVPLGRFGRLALALIGKYPAQEAAANLHRLKQLLETGRVTDTSYSVAGKFAPRPPVHAREK